MRKNRLFQPNEQIQFFAAHAPALIIVVSCFLNDTAY